MSRAEIMADPELCKYLENPFLKDNMELAIAFQEAKTGGYEEKKKFVEYLYANGPELDPDTIMYYREKCYQDPVYLEIAEIEYTDLGVIDVLRATTYGKPDDDQHLEDCFTKPCDYLGPLSANIGMMGDSNNFRTLPNVFSMLLDLLEDQKKQDKEADKKKEATKKDVTSGKTSKTKATIATSSSSSSSTSTSKTTSSTKKTDAQKKEEKSALGKVWGNIRQTLSSHIMPHFLEAYHTFQNTIFEHMSDFADECDKAGIAKTAKIGDSKAVERAESIETGTKLNVMNQLGDCSRLWEHMRRFNPYDANQNKKGPIPDDKIKNNKNLTGSANNNRTSPTVTSQLPDTKLRQEAAKGSKKAKTEIILQNTKAPITSDIIEKTVIEKQVIATTTLLDDAEFEAIKNDPQLQKAIADKFTEQTDLKETTKAKEGDTRVRKEDGAVIYEKYTGGRWVQQSVGIDLSETEDLYKSDNRLA